MKRYILYIILVNFILISCDTSLNVNADYKNIPVVFSLLDKNDTIQYIKLNKAFLGETSVSEMAQVSDSLYYDDAIVHIVKYKNNNIVATYEFVKTDTIIKDTGYFASDNNIIYIYKGSIIADGENSADYKFVLDISISGVDKLSSETKLVSDVTVLPPLGYNSPYQKNEIALYTNDYLSPEYSFKSGINAKYFEYFLVVDYYEKENGEYKLKTITHSEGTKNATSLDGGQTFAFTLNGYTFYNFIAEELTPSNEDRIFYSLRYKFLSAGEDLSMYIDLTKPTYGIVQEKPAFTNIVNGWGLFSSRTSTFSPRKKLDLSSLNYLSTGSEVENLKFKKYTETSNFYSNNRELDIEGLYIN